MIRNLFQALRIMNLLSLTNVFYVLKLLFTNGFNLLLLVKLSEKKDGNALALVSDECSYTYSELRIKSEEVASVLHTRFQIGEGKRVAFYCKNHPDFVAAFMGASRLGAQMYFFNAHMSTQQIQKMLTDFPVDLLICDESEQCIAVDGIQQVQINELHGEILKHLPKSSKGTFQLLTSGTTGKAKSVIHRQANLHFVHPFISLLTELRLHSIKSAYIATPFYHGYGFAFLCIFLAIGKPVYFHKNFSAHKTGSVIATYQIEALVAVPSILQKLLHANQELRSLSCIITGGAAIQSRLVKQVQRDIGDVLFNLYGTSETGFNVLATPSDLRYSPQTIGKELQGNRIQILREGLQVEDGVDGELTMCNEWSMNNTAHRWIATGDIGYRDQNGYFFLQGRVDDRINSGGENVYPLELEQAISLHPAVIDVTVLGCEDQQFGQRLLAYVVRKSNTVDEEQLFDWLKDEVARYQMPKKIIFVDAIPYSDIGKVDWRLLKNMSH